MYVRRRLSFVDDNNIKNTHLDLDLDRGTRAGQIGHPEVAQNA